MTAPPITNIPAAFSGLWVALATPFNRAGDVDFPAFERLVRHVVDGGVHVLVPTGTTGEASTLTDDECDAVVRACLKHAGTCPVVVGTGSNSTRRTAERTRRAMDLGAAGALVVTPYYNKPMPDGLVAHYDVVADAAPGLPITAYNVPGRTGVNLTPAVMRRIWNNPQIVALKEASGDLAQIATIAGEAPAGRLVLAGDDKLAIASITAGCAGLVSVAANVAPRGMRALVDAARAGHSAQAATLQTALVPLMDALFAESNPIPVKAALDLLGICGPGMRLPLTPATDATRARLRDALAGAEAAGRRVR